MAIRKKISNESLIPSSWIRWIILCEELTRSKIDTEEIRFVQYKISREFFEEEKQLTSEDTPDVIIENKPMISLR